MGALPAFVVSGRARIKVGAPNHKGEHDAKSFNVVEEGSCRYLRAGPGFWRGLSA